MASLSTVNVKVDSDIKREATKVLNSLGLNMSTAVNMFLCQIIQHEGIPFEIKNYKLSKSVKTALKEVDKIEKGKIKTKGYHNMDELLENLENDD